MMTPAQRVREILYRILEISYAGHPDGREARLEMIERYAKEALNVLMEPSDGDTV